MIISDWVMPGLDGLDLCRLVRGQVHRPYTYLILLTSKQGGDERLRGLRAGADDFVVKPPHADELAVRLEIARRILTVQDQLERQNRLLAHMAYHDELTGVHSRRRFREVQEIDFVRAAERGEPLSLIMVDVDHFREFNDAFGYPSGDEVLRRVATLLRDGVGQAGAMARYGGEEFVILLPAASAETALGLAERLREAVASFRWADRPITASFGVATTDTGSSRPDVLVKHADQALYRAKRAGRNRAIHSCEELPDPSILPRNPSDCG